jgi:hypothetical protein
MDKALDKVIQEEQERLRRMRILRGMIELRNSLGKIKGNSAEWVKEARKERDLLHDIGA